MSFSVAPTGAFYSLLDDVGLDLAIEQARQRADEEFRNSRPELVWAYAEGYWVNGRIYRWGHYK